MYTYNAIICTVNIFKIRAKSFTSRLPFDVKFLIKKYMKNNIIEQVIIKNKNLWVFNTYSIKKITKDINNIIFFNPIVFMYVYT